MISSEEEEEGRVDVFLSLILADFPLLVARISGSQWLSFQEEESMREARLGLLSSLRRKDSSHQERCSQPPQYDISLNTFRA